ncbi:MAG TPA: bifunctional enoyl-CoA hydratase/phosphate acetyltransferase [Synergistaceae bacterium]|mgnify:CR=1 FL=1|nr:bifunctional enoyl-CoA hydratase/phosphate acetyltransferase [Synergistaceae bacterium]HPJ26448.1 bifunctional enoyl-CoA hydratase/phosphate acetyltransferase [Synergistaceae bacterium]HPQ37154.1 bifunctional enoyl-CoA hydratase/phosphate acetyltransferase [Synergistaceae bacterium]
MGFASLDFLLDRAREGGNVKKLALACANDEDVLVALEEARTKGIVEGILVGNEAKIRACADSVGVDLAPYRLEHAETDAEAAERAVRLVSSGEADLLMKGMVKTATLLKAVLNKEWGLRGSSMLSHLFLVEVPGMKRVFGVTDGGINMYPDLKGKATILQNAVACYHKLGDPCPKVAVLAAVEVVNPDMPPTLDAAALTQMNRRGQIKGCLVDGPLALDNAVSPESASHKGIAGEVPGHADILLSPNIESCNLFAKAMFHYAGAVGAGTILGARKPLVLTSRTDSSRTKLLSIALGAALSE